MTALLAGDVAHEPVDQECTWSLCRREPELQLLEERPDGQLEEVAVVCALHVEPVVLWGRPAPLEVRIRPISPRR